MDINMTNFFDYYTSRYFFIPIYTVIYTIIIIDKEYQNYVKMMYEDNNEIY
jgi:hypothetical protein